MTKDRNTATLSLKVRITLNKQAIQAVHFQEHAALHHVVVLGEVKGDIKEHFVDKRTHCGNRGCVSNVFESIHAVLRIKF